MKLTLLICLISVFSASCSTAAKGQPLTRGPAGAKADALLHIMNSCVSGFQASGSPAPCVAVDLRSGYVVLKDQKGPSHFLVIPTKKITGIEDAVLESRDNTNYWQKAFENLSYVSAALGKKAPALALAIGVNSIATRSQNQLHLHMDCLAPEVYHWAQSAPAGTTEVSFKTEKYRVTKIDAPLASFINSFDWLHAKIGNGNPSAENHALALVVSPLAVGRLQFLLFDSDTGPAVWDRGGGSADLLMDRSCAIASGI